MRFQLIAVLVSFILTEGCVRDEVKKASTVSASNTSVVTADIQEGIERHIEENVRIGNGYFKLSFKDKELLLKLVRVHTEYLSKLGPKRHFACVDLVNVSGDVYDVDFFMSGDPGVMTVTETTVHKINGQPYYVWDQKKDGTWQRIPVDQTSERHFGIVRDRDSFEFRYWAKLPEFKSLARMWIPLPATDRFQTVEIKTMNVPGKQKILHESANGNRILFLELDSQDSDKTAEIRFQVQRLEKSIYKTPPPAPGEYLNPEKLVPLTKEFMKIAQQVIRGKKDNLVRARAIYDHVIDRMRYMKYGDGWGKGDAVYACDLRTGNCSDFHSYFIALTRSVGIPARFAIGAGIPSERNEGGIDGYHCWAEFYVDGKWWPVDISEADKYSSLATYYFGHHPANRFELSRGRDLVVDPLPLSGPINLLAYPILEVDGKLVKAKVEFSFRRSSVH